MKRNHQSQSVAALLLAATMSAGALASVTQFTSASAWQNAVGIVSTIDFTGFPLLTFITTQYRDLGVTFTDGNDFVDCCSTTLYPQDGAGLRTLGENQITIAFDTPQLWVAAHYPGALRMTLYHRGTLVHAGPLLGSFGGTMTFFVGYLSTQPFDTVVITSTASLAIDNLYFGNEFPPPCPDLTDDGVVNGFDLSVLLGFWSSPCTPVSCAADYTRDGMVNGLDLAYLLGMWGPCPKR